jgi:hypothetical protein
MHFCMVTFAMSFIIRQEPQTKLRVNRNSCVISPHPVDTSATVLFSTDEKGFDMLSLDGAHYFPAKLAVKAYT